jgi:hypothetical protein
MLQRYKTATFTLTSDDAVDFWVTDDDGYQQWKDDKTPPTAKMFTSTYCSDCLTFNTVFNLPSSTTKYYYVVSAMNPYTQASGKVEFYYDGSGDYSGAEESEDKNGCFTEEALVQFKNGSTLPLKDARVGDEILAASYNGDVDYSPVIHNPHRDNDERGRLLRIATADGSSVTLTRNHLVMTCAAQQEMGEGESHCSHCMTSAASARSRMDPVMMLLTDEVSQLSPLALRRADEVSPHRTCLLTSASASTTQWTPVLSVSAAPASTGVYTVVTRAPYPVVNGIVASPFATSHSFPHCFYHLHRVAYTLGLRSNPVVAEALAVLTDSMHEVMNLPWLRVLTTMVVHRGETAAAALSKQLNQ